MAKEQIVKFFDYITATGQESTVLTTNDAKRRFFWWWKNQGIKEYKSNQNDGSNNGRTFKCKTDIKPRSEAEKIIQERSRYDLTDYDELTSIA